MLQQEVWLKQLAEEYELPLEQVMLAYVVYEVAYRQNEWKVFRDEFEDVLDEVFKV